MKIDSLFRVVNAKSRNLEGYADGDIPFVSNSRLNNGVVNYIEPDKPNEVINDVPCLAVNGFGFATVQTAPFVGAGNGGVHIIALIPKNKMSIVELASYGAQINLASWRFSYGRRAIQRRLLQVEIKTFKLSDAEIASIKNEFIKKSAATVKDLVG